MNAIYDNYGQSFGCTLAWIYDGAVELVAEMTTATGIKTVLKQEQANERKNNFEAKTG